MRMNFECETNKQVMKMIKGEENEDVNDEITMQALKVALDLKKKNVLRKNPWLINAEEKYKTTPFWLDW